MNTAAALIPQPQAAIYVLQDGGQTVEKTFSPVYFETFLEYTHRKESTERNYTNYIKRFAEWLADQGITQPTRRDIDDYITHLETSGLAASTQAVYLQSVKYFFKWTAYEGLYPNIAQNKHGAKIRHDIHRRDALERPDVKAIAETIDRTTETGKRDYFMYLLCVTCGLRVIELHRADVGDIVTKGGRKYLYIMGKGHSEKDAPVLIVPEVDATLLDYLESRTAPATPKSPLFTSTSNRSKGGRISTTTLSVILKDILKNAGYDSSRLTAHSLRHTSATACYEATDHDLLQTQRHCRHADSSTTQVYTHIAERDQRDSEQLVYNYYFDDDDTATKRKEIKALADVIEPDKLQAVLEYMKTV